MGIKPIDDGITVLSSTMPKLLPMQGRSKGLHVSTIIRDICVHHGHYDDQGTWNYAQLELGCALEHAIAHRLSLDKPGRYIQPGEQELDGTFGTPDLYDTLDDVTSCGAIEEIKCTWMSSSRGPRDDKHWKWWAQVKAYCKMMGTRVGRLRIVFINDDYKGDVAGYRHWQQIFTQRQLDEHWYMLQGWAKRRGLNE